MTNTVDLTAYQMASDAIGKTAFLPTYHFYERHVSEPIASTPKEIIHAVATFDMREDWIANVMLALRELPSTLLRVVKRSTVESTPFGFHTFTELKQTEYELSLGLIGRFWRPDLVLHECKSASEFSAFNDNSMAKLVLRFSVLTHAVHSPVLMTETFIFCPTLRTKWLFMPYWLVIRIVSGWIRRRTLMLIQKRLSKSMSCIK